MESAARQVTRRGEVIRSRRSLDRRDTIKSAAAGGVVGDYPMRRTLRGRYCEAATEAVAA